MSIDRKLLTAYALGEARGDDLERAKAMVERDPAAKKFVDEVKAVSKRAADGLAKEPVPEGKGPAAIRAEIERRGKAVGAAAAPKKTYWVEGLVACTLLVAFVPQSRNAIMGFLRTGFQNSAGTAEYNQAAVGGPFSGGGESHAPARTVKLIPETSERLFAAVGELEARVQQVQDVGRCKVQLPALTEKDSGEPGEAQLRHTYGTEKALGGSIEVSVGAFSRKAFSWEAGEEFAKGRDYVLVKRSMGDQPAVIYFVPEAAHEPVCGVQAAIPDIDFSNDDAGEAREALQNLAKKIAESTEFK